MAIELTYMKALKKLTPREIEVLEFVGKGYTCKEIGKNLGKSPKTVEKHKENIVEQLNVSGYGALRTWYRENWGT